MISLLIKNSCDAKMYSMGVEGLDNDVLANPEVTEGFILRKSPKKIVISTEGVNISSGVNP